jgi:hypothetical protein
MLHEMRCRQADLSTVEQHVDVFICAMFATRLPAGVGCSHTDRVAVKAILNTLLDLNLGH